MTSVAQCSSILNTRDLFDSDVNKTISARPRPRQRPWSKTLTYHVFSVSTCYSKK